MSGDRQFFIVYPERRWVSEAKVITWYRDAVANGEITDRTKLVRVSDMLSELEDAGLVTQGRP